MVRSASRSAFRQPDPLRPRAPGRSKPGYAFRQTPDHVHEAAFPDRALSRAGRQHGEHRVERFGILGRAQLVGDRRIAQQPRHPRQRLQMIGAGALRREQEENRITGWLSSASKSIGRSSRANSPNRRVRCGILPCGMAMPLPTAVEPPTSPAASTFRRSFFRSALVIEHSGARGNLLAAPASFVCSL